MTEQKPARVDERSESGRRPDGYCAWHPEKGYDWETFDRDKHEAIKLSLSDLADCGQRWQIRPVTLASADSEVVLSRALVEELSRFLLPRGFAGYDFATDSLKALEYVQILDAALGGGGK